MAKEDKENEETEGAEGKGGKKKLIIIIGGVLALLIAVGATLFFTGFFDAEEPVAAEEASAEQSEESSEGDEAAVDPSALPIYSELSPSFMVNFQGGGVKIMKITMSVMARSDEVIEAVKLHDPVIRNNVLLMLSGADPEVLKTTEGKEALQTSVLEEINKVLKDRKVKTLVEAVFFTELVMQ